VLVKIVYIILQREKQLFSQQFVGERFEDPSTSPVIRN